MRLHVFPKLGARAKALPLPKAKAMMPVPKAKAMMPLPKAKATINDASNKGKGTASTKGKKKNSKVRELGNLRVRDRTGDANNDGIVHRCDGGFRSVRHLAMGQY